jgi:hypothetical protein
MGDVMDIMIALGVWALVGVVIAISLAYVSKNIQ